MPILKTKSGMNIFVPDEILKEIFILSIDYISLPSVRDSIELIRTICKHWRVTVNQILRRISSVFGLDIENPVIYTKIPHRTILSIIWREHLLFFANGLYIDILTEECYTISKHHMSTANYFAYFERDILHLYHKSLNNPFMACSFASILNSAYVNASLCNIYETQMGIVLDLWCTNAHNRFIVIKFVEGQLKQFTDADMFEITDDTYFQMLFGCNLTAYTLHKFVMTRDRLVCSLDKQTDLYNVALTKCRDVISFSHGHSSTLYLMNIKTNEILGQSGGLLYAEDSILRSNAIYHVPSGTWIMLKNVQSVSFYRDGQHYYVIHY